MAGVAVKALVGRVETDEGLGLRILGFCRASLVINDLLGTSHALDHFIDIVDCHDFRTVGHFLVEYLSHARLDVGTYLHTLRAGKRFTQLRKVFLQQSVGVLVDIVHLAVDVCRKCSFHYS